MSVAVRTFLHIPSGRHEIATPEAKATSADEQLFAATRTQHQNVQRRIRNGQTADILREPYGRDLAWVRFVLSINDMRTRMAFFLRKNLWRKVGQGNLKKTSTAA